MCNIWKKIKEFFEKKPVKIVEAILIALSAAGLIIGGVNAEEIVPKITTATVGVLVTIEALITLIQGLTTKKVSA